MLQPGESVIRKVPVLLLQPARSFDGVHVKRKPVSVATIYNSCLAFVTSFSQQMTVTSSGVESARTDW